jgi:hypothetical protein
MRPVIPQHPVLERPARTHAVLFTLLLTIPIAELCSAAPTAEDTTLAAAGWAPKDTIVSARAALPTKAGRVPGRAREELTADFLLANYGHGFARDRNHNCVSDTLERPPYQFSLATSRRTRSEPDLARGRAFGVTWPRMPESRRYLKLAVHCPEDTAVRAILLQRSGLARRDTLRVRRVCGNTYTASLDSLDFEPGWLEVRAVSDSREYRGAILVGPRPRDLIAEWIERSIRTR